MSRATDDGQITTNRRAFSEPRYIILLALLLGSQPIATDLYLPALPTIAAELGNPALTLTGLTLAFGAAQLILGPLSDRFGRRPVLLAGCASYALTSFAGAWVTSLTALVVCRCLQGAAMAALVVCARASVRDLYTPVEGAKALSRGLTGLGLFALTAPLAGALVVAQFSWHAAFVALGVFGMVAFAWVWFFFGESLPPRTPVPDADVEKRAIEMASQIAAYSPLAVQQIKELVNAGQDAALDTALRLETKALHILFSSQDQKEGMQAFIEKRKPNFTGM